MRRTKQVTTTGASWPRRSRWLAGLAFGASALVAMPAAAVTFDMGPNSTLDWTTQLKYGTKYRVTESRNSNPAFETGFFSNRISILSEVRYSYKNYGFFIRGNAWYDRPYTREDDNGNEFSNDVNDVLGFDARLLDAFVFGNFNLNGHALNVRVGRQVISWGQNTFFQGIGAAQNPLDATKGHTAAPETKSLYLPTGAVYGQLTLTPKLSMAAYYRWEWEPYVLAPQGSYFGSLLNTLPKDEPSGGQYGLKFSYMARNLGYTTFGFYYLNYHSKTPKVEVIGVIPTPPPAPPRPILQKVYAEDIQLYGVSMSTQLGPYIALRSEASYREGRPITATKRGNSLQVLVNSVTHIPMELFWSGQTTLVWGVAYNRLMDYSEDELDKIKPGTTLDAAQYTVQLSLKYFNILPQLNMTISPSYNHVFHGNSSVRSINNGTGAAGITATFQYLADWEFALGYQNFLGDVEENGNTYKDYVSASISYTF